MSYGMVVTLSYRATPCGYSVAIKFRKVFLLAPNENGRWKIAGVTVKLGPYGFPVCVSVLHRAWAVNAELCSV